MNSGIVHTLNSFSMTSRKLCDKNDSQCCILIHTQSESIDEMVACACACVGVRTVCCMRMLLHC